MCLCVKLILDIHVLITKTGNLQYFIDNLTAYEEACLTQYITLTPTHL